MAAANVQSDRQRATTTRSSEPPDPQDFEKRTAETPKDRVPCPDADDQSSVLFIAHEYIEKWFRAQGKDSD